MFKKVLLTTIVITGAIYAKDIYPVGTVLNSILPESVFQEKMGSEWVLMDGRVIDSSYEIAKYLSTNDKLENRLPDAQGKFLRMMDYRSPTNANRAKDGDPEENRQIGSYQEDSIKTHTHNYQDIYFMELWSKDRIEGLPTFGSAATDAPNYPYQIKRVSDGNGTVETRPKNIAINFFIKIKSCQTTECQ